MKPIHARACLAGGGAALLEPAAVELAGHTTHSPPVNATLPRYAAAASLSTTEVYPAALAALYGDALNRLRIRERYPVPDWSIADRWVAREFLIGGTDPALVADAPRHGSPGFPRRHTDPEDYLRRTLHCATLFSRAPAVIRLTDSPAARALCALCAVRGGWDTRFCLHTRVSYPNTRKAPPQMVPDKWNRI